MSLLNIGLQALNVSQRSLDAAGQNIANANTPGYSRQRAELVSRAAPEQGVELLDVRRVADSFAVSQVWNDSAAFKSSEAREDELSRLDDLLASDQTGISAGLDLFFGALQTAVDDPASIPNRELFLSESSAIANRFGSLNQLLEQRNAAINDKVAAQAQQLDTMAGRVAELNQKIEVATLRGEAANELHDQRDELVRQISEFTGVSVVRDDSVINLVLGNGQPLVVGTQASRVQVLPGQLDPNDQRLVVNIGGKQTEVGGEIRSGSLGGLLQFQQNVLDPARNELGRLAVVFADTLNAQHRKGMDLDGNLGGNLFTDPSNAGVVRASSENESNVNANYDIQITDSSQLVASDYRIDFTSPSEFTITRESDGQLFTRSDFTDVGLGNFDGTPGTLEEDLANGQLKLNLDGFSLSLNGSESFRTGESLLAQPVRNGARDLDLNLTSGRELALALPVRAETEAGNLGSVEVSAVEITDIDDATFNSPGNLNPPAEIVFNSDTPPTFDVLDVSDPANPQPYIQGGSPLTGQTYTSGDAIALNGFSVTLKGAPQPGDRVNIDFNTDAVSDNRNALALSGLQQAQALDQGSIQDVYGRLVASVGTDASVARINREANESVLDSSVARRESISGVNLDEEAADIIRFQQTYQAASQLIATSRSIFDTLLRAVGG